MHILMCPSQWLKAPPVDILLKQEEVAQHILNFCKFPWTSYPCAVLRSQPYFPNSLKTVYCMGNNSWPYVLDLACWSPTITPEFCTSLSYTGLHRNLLHSVQWNALAILVQGKYTLLEIVSLEPVLFQFHPISCYGCVCPAFISHNPESTITSSHKQTERL